MKNKPFKQGFKIWNRCCQKGYTYNFEIYQGARFGERQGRSRNNEVVGQPLTDQGFVVAFDQFFMIIAPPPSLDRLYENGVNAVGMILPSRVNQLIMTKN
jgi:hypothetical protein